MFFVPFFQLNDAEFLSVQLTWLANAGLIYDQQYRTDPDAGMPMPD